MTDVVSHPIDNSPDEVAAAARGRHLVVGEVVTLYALSILTALFLAGALVTVTGGSAGDVFNALLDGSIRNPGRWGLTLGAAAPLLLVALGTIVNARAGLVNIGQEGQLLFGAAFATYVGVRLGGPGPIVVVALCLAGIVGGALWAGLAGALRYWRGVPEVLTTLLLVTVAAQAIGYGLKNEWLLLAPAEGRANRNQVSAQMADDTRIPRITWFGNEFPLTVFLAIALAALTAFVLARTVPGFRLRMLGQNPRTAQRAGVGATRYGMASMLISGGFAGLAGATMLAGGDFGNYQLVPGFSTNIGWTGLLVALVARERAVSAIIVAFVFAALRTGSGFLAATGVERKITDVVQALLVLALLIPPAVLYIRERKRAVNASKERV
jgi:simple sugar transport system permease protein